MLMKKAITKLPCPIRKLPVRRPATFIPPCIKIIKTVVLRLKPSFLYSSPKVSPYAHLCTKIAAARLKTLMTLLCRPTAKVSKKA